MRRLSLCFAILGVVMLSGCAALAPMKPAEMEKLVAQLSTENAAQGYAQYHLPSYHDGHGLVV